MKIVLTAAASGVYPQSRPGNFEPVAPLRPARRPPSVSLLPAEVLSRQRRAPPPADADYDVLVYLFLVVAFLLTVWR